jgi:hypothetical protein
MIGIGQQWKDDGFSVHFEVPLDCVPCPPKLRHNWHHYGCEQLNYGCGV